jgi:hypothetical protein
MPSVFMSGNIEFLRKRFEQIVERSRFIVERTPEDRLYWRPRELPNSMSMFSCGEYILRSAGVVEQTFGGITTRLWDDPFEWTLPEKLSTRDSILEYLAEVETAVDRGFAFIGSDDELKQQMPAPVQLRSLFEILVNTIAKAENYQGRAFAIFQLFSDDKLPRL